LIGLFLTERFNIKKKKKSKIQTSFWFAKAFKIRFPIFGINAFSCVTQ